MTPTRLRQRAELTYRRNVFAGRHGWLRLTPAYSFQVVEQLLASDAPPACNVLDPFGGSGTTALVAASRGHHATTLDINPFLIWFARAKMRQYAETDLHVASDALHRVLGDARTCKPASLWQPDLHNIERWWHPLELDAISRLRHCIDELSFPNHARDLLDVAFCRTMIAVSNVAFNHQSMSFRNEQEQPSLIPAHANAWDAFETDGVRVINDAAIPLPSAAAAHEDDARHMINCSADQFDHLITSPPYANRMSYIRELRPYMYWLRFLDDSRSAGELDWTTIGGTWGVATSNTATWSPAADLPLDDRFADCLQAIQASNARNADLMSRYVEKYFHDMWAHFNAATRVLKSGGIAHYIVGNSTFYGNVVPTQDWYAALMREAGFADITVEPIRKRNSNKALYEYVVRGISP